MASLKSLYAAAPTAQSGQHTPSRVQTVRPYYLFALMVLIGLAVFTYLGLQQYTAAQETTSTLINLSGRQRMLSQRVALLASLLVNESDPAGRAQRRSDLSNTVLQMGTAHDQLTQGRLPGDLHYELSPAISAMYFNEPEPLDRRVKTYLSLAGGLIAAPDAALKADHPGFAALLDSAPGLLNALDTAVSQYDREDNARVAALERLEIVLLVVTLVVLALVTALVFYPMERLIQQEQHHLLTEINMRKQAEEELRASQRFNERLLANTPDLIYIYDVEQQRNVFDSRDLGAMLGYTPEQLAAIDGKHFPNIVHPDDLPVVMQNQAMLLSHPDDAPPLEIEFRLRDVNGSWRWFSRRNSVFNRRPDGHIWQIIGLAQDITERKALEKQAFDTAVEREYGRVLADFIRDSSHDLRTPLSVINTSLYLLERTDDPVKRGERIGTIEEQVQHLDRLIGDLHMMSNLDTTTNLTKTSQDMNQIVSDITQVYRNRLAEKNHQLLLNLTPDLPQIEIDGSEISHAISNLLDNALLYTAAGGTITIATAQDAHNLIVTVRDTGIGIDVRHLDYIFDRFYKVDSARPSGESGPGLGLTMVKKIVEMHGGRVEVESVPGAGSTFRLVLPLAVFDADSQAAGDDRQRGII